MIALFSLLALPLAVSAQIVASCNPISSASCSADKALATSFAEDFKQESNYFDAVAYSNRIDYSDDGASFTLAKRFDNPSLKSKFYIMFGKVEVILKAAPGQGIVSSFYLQSDDLDEIDIEWIGGDTTQVQSNYFSKGNTSTYDRGGFHSVSSPQTEFHNYTIDWNEDAVNWYVDGTLVRTVPSDAASGFPQSPMYVVLGVWAGGDPSNEAGTIEWAGGLTDYTQAPFTMYVKSLIASDYSTGSEYVYGDQTGSWESIQAVDGQVNGRISQAQEDFAALAAGDKIENVQSSSSVSSRSSSSSTSSSVTSSGSLVNIANKSSTRKSSASKSSTSTSASKSSSSSSVSESSSTSSASKSSTSSSVSKSVSGRSQTILATSSTLDNDSSSRSSTQTTSTVINHAISASSSSSSENSSITSQNRITSSSQSTASNSTISSASITSSVVEANSGNSNRVFTGSSGLYALLVSVCLASGSLLL